MVEALAFMVFGRPADVQRPTHAPPTSAPCIKKKKIDMSLHDHLHRLKPDYLCSLENRSNSTSVPINYVHLSLMALVLEVHSP